MVTRRKSSDELKVPRDVRERFARNHCPEPTTGCWLWTASVIHAGYGRIRAGGRSMSAHRCSYELHVGPIPENLCVLHTCDTPACVNPAHLFLGTVVDNNADRDAKGRGADNIRFARGREARGDAHWSRRRPDLRPRGEGSGTAKLTEAKVREIRAARAGGESMDSIARRYGVVPDTIAFVVRRVTWTHVI